MLRSLANLLFVSAWAVAVSAQEPDAGDVARALLLGPGFERAAEYVDAFAGRPHEQALLEASALPAPARARAMLALAQACVDQRNADRALVAGAACLLLAQRRYDLVPGLLDREPEVAERFDEQMDDAELSRLLASYLEVLVARQASGEKDASALREAARLLRQARVAAVANRVVLVRPETALPVPAPLAESLRLRAWPTTLERSVMDAAGDAVGDLLADHELPAGVYGQRLSALPIGTHLLELTHDDRPWRVVRPVLVSDLDAVAMRFARETHVLVERDGRPVVGAEVRLLAHGEHGEGDLATTDDEGLAELRHQRAASGRILVTAGEHRTLLALPYLYRQSAVASQRCHHLAVDRPIYRTEQLVQARLRLQAYQQESVWAGGELVPSLRSQPARGTNVRIVLWPGTSHQVERSGRADERGEYAFAFEVPATAPAGDPEVHLFVGSDERERLSSPFTIAAFRRAAIVVAVTGRDELPSDGVPTDVVVAARYASGAPAAGLAASVRVRAASQERVVETVLDERGHVKVPVAVSGDDFRAVVVEARITSPDGAVVRATHRMRVRRSSTTASRVDRRVRLAIDAPRSLVRGERADVLVRGPANSSAMLAVARGEPWWTMRLQFDAQGRSRAQFELPESIGPSVDLVVANGDGRDRARIDVVAPHALAALEVKPEANEYGPGEEVVLRVRTRDARGRGVAGSVTLSVVDERVFALRSERSLVSGRGLRPNVPRLRWRSISSPRPADPLVVIGAMLRDGRLVSGSIDGSPLPMLRGPAAAGASAGGPSMPASVQVRKQFRETAHFAPSIATDHQGRAEVRFRLPDDLTTFRISAVAFDAEGRAAEVRSQIEVARAISVTPLAPRLLRSGDRVRMPAVVDARASSGQGVRLACDASGAAGAELVDETPVLIEGVGEAVVDLVARQAGEAAVRFTATQEDGDPNVGDAIDLTLPVQADIVRRYHVDATRFAAGHHALPIRLSDGEKITLELLDGRSAVLRAARQFLVRYPHGCVEQTLSRLLPFLVGGVDRDGEHRERLRAGWRRLRELRDRERGGFAWWPGGRADDGMTALVLHGLVHARAVGVDLVAEGLAPDAGQAIFTRALAALLRRGARVDSDREAQVAEAELLAALVRWQADADHLALLRRMVDAEQDLPAGLLLRSGLALVQAGDGARAAAILDRVDTGAAVAVSGEPWNRFPGEGDATIQAARLELLVATMPDDQRTPAAAAALLDAFGGRGFGSTYDSSSAFVALVAEAGGIVAVAPERIVRVASSEGEREVVVGGERTAERIELPFEPVTLDVPDGEPVLATWRVEVHESGSANVGWNEGLTVTRKLLRQDGTPCDRGPLERLQAVEVRVTVTAKAAARYVAVECPLPAGFELATTDARWEAHDDRVVATISRMRPHQAVRLAFTVVPSLVGSLRWPPAVASAMYAPQFQGGSAGSVLAVEPARERLAAPIEPLSFVAKRRTTERRRSGLALALDEFVAAVRDQGVDGGLRSARSGEVPPELRATATASLEALASASLQADEWLAIARRLPEPSTEACAGAAPSIAQRHATVLLDKLRQATARRLLRQCLAELHPSGGDGVADYDAVETCLDAIEFAGEMRVDLAAELARQLCQALAACSLDREWIDEQLIELLWSCGDELHARMQDEWGRLVVHPSADVREAAVAELSDARLAALPATLVARAVNGDWSLGTLRQLCGGASGRAWIARKLRDREWCAQNVDELCQDLVPDMWSNATAATVAAVVQGGWFEEVRRRLSTDRVRSAIPLCEDLESQCALVGCLIHRGEFRVVDIGGEFGAVLGFCLQAAGGDVDGVARLREWLRSDVDAQPYELRQLAIVSLGPSMRVAEFLAVCDELDDDRQRAVIQRWSRDHLVRLLRTVGSQELAFDALPTRWLPDLEHELDACAARLPERREEVEEVLARIPARARARDLLRAGVPR